MDKFIVNGVVFNISDRVDIKEVTGGLRAGDTFYITGDKERETPVFKILTKESLKNDEEIRVKRLIQGESFRNGLEKYRVYYKGFCYYPVERMYLEYRRYDFLLIKETIQKLK